jgi:hypothetical protein
MSSAYAPEGASFVWLATEALAAIEHRLEAAAATRAALAYLAAR